MRTACSLIVSPYLIVSHAHSPFATHGPPFATHAPFTTHVPLHHTCPRQPCMPPSNHTCPPAYHAHPLATMHAPWQPYTSPINHTCPPATTHAPPPPPVNRITHACENITLPQLRCGRLLLKVYQKVGTQSFIGAKSNWNKL